MTRKWRWLIHQSSKQQLRQRTRDLRRTQHHKLTKRGLRIGHINNSIRTKINEIAEILFSNNFQILAILETHLDLIVEDTALMIQGYNIFRRDQSI